MISFEPLRSFVRLPGAKTPTHCINVSALGAGCKTFVTNDRRVPTVPGLRVIQLSSYIDSR